MNTQADMEQWFGRIGRDGINAENKKVIEEFTKLLEAQYGTTGTIRVTATFTQSRWLDLAPKNTHLN